MRRTKGGVQLLLLRRTSEREKKIAAENRVTTRYYVSKETTQNTEFPTSSDRTRLNAAFLPPSENIHCLLVCLLARIG